MYMIAGSLNKTALRHVPCGLRGHKSADASLQRVFLSGLSLVLESARRQKQSTGSLYSRVTLIVPISEFQPSPCFA